MPLVSRPDSTIGTPETGHPSHRINAALRDDLMDQDTICFECGHPRSDTDFHPYGWSRSDHGVGGNLVAASAKTTIESGVGSDLVPPVAGRGSSDQGVGGEDAVVAS